MQPETHVQHMVNVIDNGMNVQMTTDAARFTHSQNSNALSLEDNLYSLVGRALAGQGARCAFGERRQSRWLSGHLCLLKTPALASARLRPAEH